MFLHLYKSRRILASTEGAEDARHLQVNGMRGWGSPLLLLLLPLLDNHDYTSKTSKRRLPTGYPLLLSATDVGYYPHDRG